LGGRVKTTSDQPLRPHCGLVVARQQWLPREVGGGGSFQRPVGAVSHVTFGMDANGTQ